jgi:hypothetical protein
MNSLCHQTYDMTEWELITVETQTDITLVFIHKENSLHMIRLEEPYGIWGIIEGSRGVTQYLERCESYTSCLGNELCMGNGTYRVNGSDYEIMPHVEINITTPYFCLDRFKPFIGMYPCVEPYVSVLGMIGVIVFPMLFIMLRQVSLRINPKLCDKKMRELINTSAFNVQVMSATLSYTSLTAICFKVSFANISQLILSVAIILFMLMPLSESILLGLDMVLTIVSISSLFAEATHSSIEGLISTTLLIYAIAVCRRGIDQNPHRLYFFGIISPLSTVSSLSQLNVDDPLNLVIITTLYVGIFTQMFHLCKWWKKLRDIPMWPMLINVIGISMSAVNVCLLKLTHSEEDFIRVLDSSLPVIYVAAFVSSLMTLASTLSSPTDLESSQKVIVPIQKT